MKMLWPEIERSAHDGITFIDLFVFFIGIGITFIKSQI